ncbi:MAG: nuclear transport factor 2 family protein [Gemmatimonadales bacterium]
MPWIALLAGAILSALATAPASAQADSIGAVAMVDQFHRLLEGGDTTGVMATLAPEVLILEGGSIETRDEYRAHHLAADIAAVRAAPSARTVTRVSVSGAQGWVVSTSIGKREVRGQPVEAITAELVVLRRVSGAWRIVAIHWSGRTRRLPPVGAVNPP